MPNETIHHEIDSWLAADVHNQLSDEERAAFQQHLSGCPACRALQQEEKNMHQVLESTLAEEKADPAFEQRMVRRFRDKIPAREGMKIIPFFASLMRTRPVQITAVAAILLALVQVGRLVTGEQGKRPQSLAFAPPLSLERNDRRAEGMIAERSAPQSQPFADALASGAPVDLQKSLAAKDAEASAPFSAAGMEQEEKTDQADADTRTELAQQNTAEPPDRPAAAPIDSRKLIRNAQLELKVVSYETAVQSITAFAMEAGGFVATQNSSKLPNGKLQGTIVVKVAPGNLDRFLQEARGLGELKNQTLGTDDITKTYFDTDARLRNARRMEERLLEMLQKNTGKVSDLLQVEKELARVREQIEQMQGELKYYDALVQYATVTIALAEKDLDEPAAFLLKETANLSLFSPNVEKTFGAVKDALRGAKAQIVQSTLDRDNTGQATARMTLLIAPEESDAVIARIKAMGRVQNFNVQTERVAQNGSGMSDTAKVERDKVQLNLVISHNEEEPAVQQTSLRILATAVSDQVARLKAAAAKVHAEVRSSTFSRNPDGQEVANITLRVPLKNYADLVASFDQLGEVKDLSVQRNDRPGTTASAETAPADVSVQIYSAGKIVSDETSISATIRRTLGQGVAALMWSLRMIGVALAFLAPWALALGLLGWLLARIAKRRGNR